MTYTDTGIGPFLNNIICGDCIDVMKTMPPESVDLIVTDPPYIVNYRDREGRSVANDDNAHWLDATFLQMYRVLKPNRFCVSFYGYYKVDRFMQAWCKAGLYPVGHFVGVKHYASGNGYTRRCHESAYLLAKGKPEKPKDPPGDVLPWLYTGNRLHPTEKPVSTLLPLVERYSEPGDVVLDPFAGSGSTAVAAHWLGRQYIGIELDEAFHRKASLRLEWQTVKNDHAVRVAA